MRSGKTTGKCGARDGHYLGALSGGYWSSALWSDDAPELASRGTKAGLIQSWGTPPPPVSVEESLDHGPSGGDYGKTRPPKQKSAIMLLTKNLHPAIYPASLLLVP